MALSRKGASHVPYRQTKLTNVLKDALGGNCNTLMFSCIWGESAHLEETISTLRLAQRMMRVQNDAATVTVTDPVKMVKKQVRVGGGGGGRGDATPTSRLLPHTLCSPRTLA